MTTQAGQDIGAEEASPSPLGRALVAAGLVPIALNLRLSFSSLSAVLPEVMRGTGGGSARRAPDDDRSRVVPRPVLAPHRD